MRSAPPECRQAERLRIWLSIQAPRCAGTVASLPRCWRRRNNRSMTKITLLLAVDG